jgi:PAS domain S-box-containing protein
MERVPLRKKLILFFLSTGIVSALVAAIFSERLAGEYLLEITKNSLEAKAVPRASAIKQALRETANKVSAFSFHPAIGESLAGASVFSLEDRVAIQDEFTNIFIVSREGEVKSSAYPSRLKSTNLVTGAINSGPYALAFRNAFKGDYITGVVHIDGETEPSLVFSSAIFNDIGKIVGVVVAEMPVEALLKDVSFDALAIFSEEGLVGTNSKDFKNEDAGKLYKTAIDDGSGTVEFNAKADPVIAFLQPIEISGVKWVVAAYASSKSAFAPLVNIRNNIIVISSLIALIMAILIYLGVRSVFGRIERIKTYISSLSRGELPELQKPGNPDELGEIVRAINKLNSNLKSTAEFAINIGNGNFDYQFKSLSEKDKLGQSLSNMRGRLLEIAEEDKKRNWATEGFAKFGEILRANNDDLEKLCEQVLANLIKYLQANQGCLFILSQDGNPSMELIAAYAYERNKFMQKKIAYGEGLAGQCWREKGTIFITDVPEDFVHITSGLGDASPRCILIVPLKSNDEIYGILEIASFHVLQDYQVSFVEKLGESIASTISTVKVNERTKKLLHESQKQAEQLRQQEEEMRKNMREMQATQEEMKRIQEEMHAQNNIVNSIAIVSKTDSKGRITYVNDEFIKWTKYSWGEVMGQNHRFLKSGHQPEEIFTDLWSTVSSGKVWRGELKNKAKDGSFFWVDTIIAPVLDHEGKAKEYIAQRFLIDDKKRKEEEMKSMVIEMQNQIREIEKERSKNIAIMEGSVDGVITFNQHGDIEFFNKAAEEIWELSREAVLGNHISGYLPLVVENKGSEIEAYSTSGELIGIRKELNVANQSGEEIPVLCSVSRTKINNEFFFTAYIQSIAVELF